MRQFRSIGIIFTALALILMIEAGITSAQSRSVFDTLKAVAKQVLTELRKG